MALQNLDRATRGAAGASDQAAGAAGRLTGRQAALAGAVAGVSARLLNVGLDAGRAAINFDTSMSRITGLVGIAADEVNVMRGQVLQLGGATGRAPQELAEALFSVTSAGFRGQEAMDVLEASARAAAAGLGSTNDVAFAVGSAVNAYGSEVLSASAATDILTGTVRAGNLEASSLASVLGNVTPIASQAGISLADVGGAMALLTRSGASAGQAATQTSAAIRAMLAPNEQLRAALDASGISAEQLRRTMAEQGLVAALQLVETATGGSADTMARALGSSEAFAAASTILSASQENLAATFGAVADSAGVTDEAFAAVSDTAGFKMQQAMASLQGSLTSVMTTAAPLIGTVADAITTVIGAFNALPGPVQNIALIGGLALGAVGPITNLVANVGTLAGGVSGLATKIMGAGGLNPAMIGIGAAVAVGVPLLVSMFDRTSAVDEAVQRLSDSLLDSSGAMNLAADAMRTYIVESSRFDSRNQIDDLQRLGVTAGQLDEMLRGGTEGLNQFIDAAAAGGEITPRLADALQELAADGQITEDELRELAWTSDLLQGSNVDLISSFMIEQQAMQRVAEEGARLMVTMDQVSQAQLDAAVAANTAADGTTNWVGVQERLQAEQAGVARATEAITQALVAAAAAQDAAAQGGQVLADSQGEAEGAMEGAADAAAELQGEVASAADAMRDLIGINLGAEAALSDVHEAMDAIAQSSMGAAGALDLTTQAGRDNRAAIRDAADAALKHAEALAATGASASEIRGALNGHVEDLRAVMRQAGLSEQAIDGLIREYGLVPDNIETIAELLVAEAAAEAARLAATYDRELETTHTARALLDSATAGRDTDALHRRFATQLTGTHTSQAQLRDAGATQGAGWISGVLRSALTARHTSTAALSNQATPGAMWIADVYRRTIQGTRMTTAGLFENGVIGLADRIARAVLGIPTSRHVSITSSASGPVAGAGGAITRAVRTGGYIDAPRDAPVPATLHGGEYVLSADVVDAITNRGPTLGRNLGVNVGAGGGGGGVSIASLNVYAGMGADQLDGERIGRQIIAAIQDAELGSGRRMTNVGGAGLAL